MDHSSNCMARIIRRSFHELPLGDIFERRDGETAQAYEAARVYFDLRVKRSIIAAVVGSRKPRFGRDEAITSVRDFEARKDSNADVVGD